MAIDSGYTITPISGKNGEAGADGKDGKDGANGTGITVQYSVNGTTGWHDTFASGDIYMRQSTDGGANWSVAMRIVGEKGATGATGATGKTGATGATGVKGEDGYSIQILSFNGTVFKNGSGNTILSACVYQGGIELDPEGTEFQYSWKKYNAAGERDVSFSATTKSITVFASDVDNKNDFEVEVTL